MAPTLRRTGVVAAGLVAIALAAGCTAPVAPQQASRGVLRMAPAGVATGTVRVDGAAIARAWRGRLQAAEKTVLGSSITAVASVRLVVRGPGLSELRSASVPFETKAVDLGFTLAVPAGFNRVFAVEGLNADGQVVRCMRGACTVVAGEDVVLSISPLTDAVARVIDDVVSAPPLSASEIAAIDARADKADYLDGLKLRAVWPDTAGIDATLQTTDLVKDLTATIDAYVGYDPVANTFAGVAPSRFRRRLLANYLRRDGVAALATSHAELADPAQAQVFLAVTDSAGPVYDATTYVFDPDMQSLAYGSVGGYAFTSVAPGTYAVAATRDGHVAYGTCTIEDLASIPTINLSLPVRAALPPSLTYAIYGDGVVTPWQASAAGGVSIAETAAPDADNVAGGAGMRLTYAGGSVGQVTLTNPAAGFSFAGLTKLGLKLSAPSDTGLSYPKVQLVDQAGQPVGTPIQTTGSLSVGAYQYVAYDLTTMDADLSLAAGFALLSSQAGAVDVDDVAVTNQ